MMKLLKPLSAAAVFATLATLAPPAEAQSTCNSATKVLDAIWGRWGERIKSKGCKNSNECLSNTQKKEDLVKEMLAFWNEQAQNSWATIGPRALTEHNDGKVLLGLARLFISQSVLDNDKYEIVVTKEGGGAAEISFSTYDGKTCMWGKSVFFDKDDKPGTKKTMKVDDAKGLLGMVKVDAKGTSAFDYRFSFKPRT